MTQDGILDPADLDLDEGYSESDLCFSKSQVRDPAYALLDSGATHMLLPGHMLPKGARSFEVTVNLAVEKRRPSVGAMRSMQKTGHIHFFDWIQSLYGKMVLLLCNAEIWASGEP